MLLTSMFGSLGVLFALMWKARSAPLNYYLLALFTLFESHMVGTVGKYINHEYSVYPPMLNLFYVCSHFL